jgi:shikimate kinase
VLRFQQFLNEGVDDPAIFKAVFLAGGPGSGKSFIVGRTGLPALGYRVINSDDAFEAGLRKAKMDMTPDNIFSPQGQEIRGRAKRITNLKNLRSMWGRLGLVIDGTGKDTDKVASQMNSLKALGYDCAMIFVNTDLDTALKRNRMRARTLPDAEVEKYWKEVQRNIGKFQQMFGKENFIVADNSEGKDYKQETLRAYKDIRKFTEKPPKSEKAKKWIEKMRDIKKSGGQTDKRKSKMKRFSKSRPKYK